MKSNTLRRCLLTLIPIAFLCAWEQGQAGILNISRPHSIGFLLVGTRQDASQINDSGMGGGAEFFLRYGITSRLTLSGSTGIFTITDNVFRMDRMKTTIIPSVELRTEYNFIRGEWFKPFLYSGFHFHGASTKQSLQPDSYVTDYDYRLSFLAGLGAEFSFGSSRYHLYTSADYRYAFVASDPKPQYWIMKTGVAVDLGSPAFAEAREQTATEFAELPDDFFLDFTKEDNTYPAAESENRDGDLESKIQELKYDLRDDMLEIKALVSSNTEQLATLSQRMASQQKTDEPVPRQKTTSPPSFMEWYQEGLSEFRDMEYEKAIDTFAHLLINFPNHDLGSNCHYWIGECYHALGKYSEAISAFDRVLAHAESYKLDDALLMRGKMYINLDRWDSASADFEELLQRFPDSEYVTQARSYLKK